MSKSPWRSAAIWGSTAFGVTLALIIGLRLDRLALTVLVGVVCGVGASIPTALLIVTLTNRRYEKRRPARPPALTAPPVILVTSPRDPQTQWPAAHPLPAPSQREFAVIGDEILEN